MNNQPESKPARRLWRSIGAVLAGLVAIVFTHLGTDAVMHATAMVRHLGVCDAQGRRIW